MPIYMRDPHCKVVGDQLNGGEFVDLSPADWDLILPYLKENEKLFGISIEKDLLTVNGEKKDYNDVYRKVQAVTLDVLAKESVAVEEWGEDWQKLEKYDAVQWKMNRTHTQTGPIPNFSSVLGFFNHDICVDLLSNCAIWSVEFL